LLERAYTAGYQALCLTVDASVLGKPEQDQRNKFTLPPGLHPANLTKISGLDILHAQRESGLLTYFPQQINPALTWKDLECLQSLGPLPLVLKAILRGDDTVRALEYSA
jgi:4-hydroxymandelate oxidase